MHVAESMDTEDECIAAILHDIVEDTDVTIEQLAEDFSSNIVEAVRLLTRNDTMPYDDYIKNIKTNPIARKVKLADLKHNMDNTRLKEIGPKDVERFKKYEDAVKVLSE